MTRPSESRARRLSISAESALPAPLAPAEARSGPAAVAGAGGRIESWDLLRVLAFADVVSLHVANRHALLGVGLPVFLLLAFGLGSRRRASPGLAEVAAVRVRRLLLPFLAWSAVYGVLLAVAILRHHQAPGAGFRPIMLLCGTEDHLWFLPFAFAGGLAVHLLQRAGARLGDGWLLAGAFGAAALLLALGAGGTWGHPHAQWMFALPSIPLGLALGRILSRPRAEARGAWGALLGGALAAMAALWLLGLAGAPPTPSPAFRYLLVLALLAAGALLPGAGGAWAARLEPLMLGAYVAHPAVYFQGVRRLEDLAGISAPLAATLVTAALTLALVAALRRTRLRAVL
jgi:hypothetical protein